MIDFINGFFRSIPFTLPLISYIIFLYTTNIIYFILTIGLLSTSLILNISKILYLLI